MARNTEDNSREITKAQIKHEMQKEKKELSQKRKEQKLQKKEQKRKDRESVPKKYRTSKAVKKTIRVILAIAALVSMLIGACGTFIYYILNGING